MSFHLYTINELYSNADGSVQFIELAVGPFSGESFWQGQSIRVTQGATTHSFTFPANLPSTATANTTVLIATQGFANLGVVAPDFIVPAGFLFTNGGTVNFAGVDSVSYASLPTDGALSINRSGATATNTPRDFAGATGSVAATGSPPGTGTGAGTTVLGGTANDTVTVGAGNTAIDGGAGTDTAVFASARSTYTVAQSGATWTVSSPSGTSTLTNVERLKFADATLALDTGAGQIAGQAYRIYKAAFNRVPDTGGLTYWIGVMDSGADLTAIAAGFMGSAEFKGLYGANAGNSDFLTRVYSNVLGRAPDPGGFAFWLDHLNAGRLGRDQLLANFSESPENQAGVADLIRNGIALNSQPALSSAPADLAVTPTTVVGMTPVGMGYYDGYY